MDMYNLWHMYMDDATNMGWTRSFYDIIHNSDYKVMQQDAIALDLALARLQRIG